MNIIYNEYGLVRSWLIVIGGILIAALLIIGFVVGVQTLGNRVGASSCHKYGKNTGHIVRWERNGFFDQDCYVQTPSGWVERGNVHYVTTAP